MLEMDGSGSLALRIELGFDMPERKDTLVMYAAASVNARSVNSGVSCERSRLAFGLVPGCAEQASSDRS
jgi:hypothetical protein